MNFRYDINGLRAIAVIAVVLFHFNPAWVPGGFAGVDVFFVISGFLMTGIIFRGLEDKEFNLLKFYSSRVKRIIPALITVCFLLIILAFVVLDAYKSTILYKHIASSLSFFSNVIFWKEAGYFDELSKEKWLLHTWSLSVEWQFYLLYPLVLVTLKRLLSLESLKRLIVVGTILGFALSVVATMKWPSAAYYLLPTRAWEMMMGGVAFLYPWSLSESQKKIAELTGLALILLSYVFLSGDSPWPGHLALIPVLGSYLMLVANRQDSWITNNRTFQKIGNWSYSIYLWHWPVLVYGFIYDIKIDIFSYVAVVFMFSFTSFYLVERKSKRLNTLAILLVTFFVIAFSSFMYTYQLSDMNEREMKLSVTGTSHEICKGIEDNCAYYGKDERVDFILWGDSHSIALSHYLANNSYNFIVFSTSGCPPIQGVRRHDGIGNANNCNQKKNDIIFNKIKESHISDKVIMIGRWSLYRYGWLKKGQLQKATHFLCSDNCESNIDSDDSFYAMKTNLKATVGALSDKKVIMFLGNPILNNRGIDKPFQTLKFDNHKLFQSDTDDFIKSLSAENVGFIESSPFFFEDGNVVVYKQGLYLYKDDNHPTLDGWDYAFKNGFKSVFDSMVLSN